MALGRAGQALCCPSCFCVQPPASPHLDCCTRRAPEQVLGWPPASGLQCIGRGTGACSQLGVLCPFRVESRCLGLMQEGLCDLVLPPPAAVFPSSLNHVQSLPRPCPLLALSSPQPLGPYQALPAVPAP